MTVATLVAAYSVQHRVAATVQWYDWGLRANVQRTKPKILFAIPQKIVQRKTQQETINSVLHVLVTKSILPKSDQGCLAIAGDIEQTSS